MDDARGPLFTVNGVEYELASELDMGEMCDAERYWGVEFGNQETSKVRMAAALVWITIKRQDPTVTIDDIRALPPEVFASMTTEHDARPPVPAEEPSSTNGSSGESSSNGAGDPDSVQLPTGSPV
jgi:hypothetical protein